MVAKYRPKLLAVAMALTAAATASAQEEGFRVYAVDLYGNPRPNVEVRLKAGAELFPKPNEARVVTDASGIATVRVTTESERGELKILVNVNLLDEKKSLDPSLIGRSKRVTWGKVEEFSNGFAVPLWAPDEVPRLADVVITNPTHYAVAVQFGKTLGSRHQVVATIDEDVDGWISSFAPDLPRVVKPPLARAIYAETIPGEPVPARFDSDMEDVMREVERQNAQVRICRLFPQGRQPESPGSGLPIPGTTPGDGGPGTTIPPRPPSSGPAIGTVVVHNQGQCAALVTINNQPVQIRPGGATSLDVFVAPVRTATYRNPSDYGECFVELSVVPRRARCCEAVGNVLQDLAERLAGSASSQQPTSTRVWNHWQLANGRPTLTLYALSRVRRASPPPVQPDYPPNTSGYPPSVEPVSPSTPQRYDRPGVIYKTQQLHQ